MFWLTYTFWQSCYPYTIHVLMCSEVTLKLEIDIHETKGGPGVTYSICHKKERRWLRLKESRSYFDDDNDDDDSGDDNDDDLMTIITILMMMVNG